MLEAVEDVVADHLLVAQLQELPALGVDAPSAGAPSRARAGRAAGPSPSSPLSDADPLDVLLPHAVHLVRLQVARRPSRRRGGPSAASASARRACRSSLSPERSSSTRSQRTSGASVSPWTTSVPRMTANVMKMMRLRAGNGRPSARTSGSDRAAASETTPRIPAQPDDDDRLPRRIRVRARGTSGTGIAAGTRPETSRRGGRRPSSRTSRRSRPRRPATASPASSGPSEAAGRSGRRRARSAGR